MKSYLFGLLLLATSVSSPMASAGFFEIGGSVNYRSSGYDKNNYIESLTYTATGSYYFWEMCAWEINYTTGTSAQMSQGTDATDPKTLIEDSINMTSLDLVISFAGRQDPIRPYIKMGAGYLTKERFRKINDDPKERISKQNGIVPSGGIGLSVNLTKEISLKIGVDAWTSPMDKDEPTVVDYAGRAGASWMF